MMHGHEQSDSIMVAVKPVTKVDGILATPVSGCQN
jgi:hypothetical protein